MESIKQWRKSVISSVWTPKCNSYPKKQEHDWDSFSKLNFEATCIRKEAATWTQFGASSFVFCYVTCHSRDPHPSNQKLLPLRSAQFPDIFHSWSSVATWSSWKWVPSATSLQKIRSGSRILVGGTSPWPNCSGPALTKPIPFRWAPNAMRGTEFWYIYKDPGFGLGLWLWSEQL